MTGSVSPISLCATPRCRMPSTQSWSLAATLSWPKLTYAKIDIRNAFRLCPVRPEDHHLLGMRWQGQFFFDRVLPFGLRSAPCIFNSLAEAIEWLAKHSSTVHIHHYLDDFFLAGEPGSEQCAHQLHSLTTLGIKRVHGLFRDSRLPITPRLLRQFRLLLNFSYPDHRTLWAAMLVAFFGFLRSNELLAITNRDIQRTRVG